MKDTVIKWIDQTILACLCCVIFCLPFTKAGQETFTWMAVSLWTIKKLLGHKITPLKNSLFSGDISKAILIFVMINALSMVTSVNFSLSLRAFLGKICKFVVLFFIVIETINNRKRLKSVLIAIIISAGLITIDAIVQYFRGVDFLRGFPYDGLRASFSSTNGFGGWLIVVIPILLSILITKEFRGKKIIKVVLAGLLALLLICLRLTDARGAWLGFALGLGFICYWVAKPLPHRRKIFFYFFTIICLICIFIILPQTTKERISSIGRIRGSNLKRIVLWKESWSIVQDFPIFGCGLNTYSVVARNYKMIEGGGIYPHNSFLQMAAETGIIGLSSFVWILIALFRLGFLVLKKQKDPLVLGLLAGILSFLTQSFFDTNLYALQLVVLFWLMMGLSVAVIRLDMGVDR